MAFGHRFAGALLWLFSAGVIAADQPNILLLLADDMGYNDLAINNHNDMPTPTLDRLANQSIRFNRFYADATCQPSRAALISGRYPARSGFRPVGRGLPPEWITLPEALKALGYRTHHVGKWHLGHTPIQAWPAAQGFDTSFGFLNQWMLGGPVSEGNWSLTRPGYENPWLTRGFDASQQYQGHLEDLLTQETVQLIENADQKTPWFIYHAFFAPHTPNEPAQRYREQYPDTPDGIFRAVIHQLDDSVEKILQALEESGQADNTIVVFASDNGGINEARNNNAPFVGAKGEFREGGIRTFMLWRWPDHAVTGVNESTVSMMDIYPSLLQAAGGTPGNSLDGVALFEPNKQQPHVPARTLFWEAGTFPRGYRAVVSDDGAWHYMTNNAFVGLYNARVPGEQMNEWWRVPTWWSLENQYALWRERTQQVETHRLPQGDTGRAKITGDSFQRTPGLSGFTWGVGMQLPSLAGDAWEAIVDQAGVWRLEYHPREGFRGNINGLMLNAKPIQRNASCVPVVVTGFWFLPSLLWGGEPDSWVSLYVDGKEVATTAGKYRDVSANAVEQPTWLGQLADGGQPFSGRLGVPKFLNTALASGWMGGDIKDFSKSLCQD
ncbi:MAG TPA: sulfatase-like hydrolase/transferase [Pseudomonadales bacterium]